MSMLVATLAGTAQANTNLADLNLDRLFADGWEWRLHEYPELATALGDHRFDDKLSESSQEAFKRRAEHRESLNKQLRKIDRKKLSRDNRFSYDVFRWQLDDAMALDNLYKKHGASEDWDAINHMDGVHVRFASVIATSRFDTEEDYRKYIARLDALADKLDHTIEITRSSAKTGWVLPRASIERVPSQIDRIIGKDINDCTWYAPFLNISRNIPSELAEKLQMSARKTLAEKTLPALRKYLAYIVDEYIPHARNSLASSELPAGLPYYELKVRSMTTTHATPEEIHQIGLSEVARIRHKMEAIAKGRGFAGTLPDFIKFVREQPDQYYSSPQELLNAYLALGKQVDPLMARLFRTLPRSPWGIRPATPEEQGNADHYLPAAEDGSRPGYFVVDNSRPASRPKYEMTALLLHEAVPGHHLQTARAAELENIPAFRRHGWFTAFGEGWALYAESLGEELGLYQNDLDLLGRYTYEIWRASRLVVDTGLHAKGWGRQQAIDYMLQATGGNPDFIASEVDRYIVLPGQALAYKMGEITIRKLRQQAEESLGKRFDLRAFHNMILDGGTLPLSMLQSRSDEWIASQKRTSMASATTP